jgi:hypothetical protein
MAFIEYSNRLKKIVSYHLYCCRNLELRYWTLKQFSRKQHFIVMAQTQWTRVQRLSPENKRSHLIYPCKQVTEAKIRSNPYMVTHNSIGYFYPNAR